MSIDAISLSTLVPELLPANETVNTAGQGNFSQWFNTELNELNQQILSSETKLEKLATGESNNLHDVMMSLEKAKLSFQLTLEVRNKLLEGYQQIMRMQI